MRAMQGLAPHRQLNAQVSEQIRHAILQGNYGPGMWLRQQHIAEELGVSQMPVREALKQLVAEGLLEHIPYRGVRVVQISSQDVADLYTHRSFLESWAAGKAAEHISPDELAELQKIHERMSACQLPEQISEYRRLNRQFHELIFRASRSRYLVRVLNQMWSTFPTMLWGNFAQTAVATLPTRDATDQPEHAAILTSLRAGDGKLAEIAMRQHIEAVAAELLAMLDTEKLPD